MAGSLASATSTRVDSASKHIIPCKVNTDYMASLMEDTTENAMRELQQNKMRYCMHKDDVVIGLGRPQYGASMNNSRKKAYPSVVVTLASMAKAARKFIAVNNFLVQDYTHLNKIKKNYLDILYETRDDATLLGAQKDEDYIAAVAKAKELAGKKDIVKRQIDNMLQMYFVGISLGLAYAHPHSGDTVASVMIGGLRTVLNGHFQIHTNDLLMFYWDDELPLFEENGGRKDRRILLQDPQAAAGGGGGGGGGAVQVMLDEIADLSKPSYSKIMDWVNKDTLSDPHSRNGLSRAAAERKAYYAMGQGTYPAGPDGQGAVQGKINVARIKPYIVSRYPDPLSGGPQHFPMDKCRIFGKAISNAQPFEMVDIMLSRQAI